MPYNKRFAGVSTAQKVAWPSVLSTETTFLLDRLCFVCEWLPSLLAITVANNFLSNLIWRWGPTKNVPVPSRVWIFWRIPRFFLCMGMDRMDISSMHSVYVNMCICNCMYLIFLSWISAHLCIHLYYVISYSGPSHFELSWHEMHIGKHNQNCGEYWRMLGRHVLWKNALSIECFSPCNSSIHFFLLANLHGCMWTVSTGVRQIPSYDSYQLSPTNVGPSLLWLICHSGGWFFNHSLIKSIIASFVPGRAVIALMRCAPTLNATIGHWMKKGLRLSAVEGLPAACWAIRFFLVFKWGHTWLPNSEFEAIWNQLKS